MRKEREGNYIPYITKKDRTLYNDYIHAFEFVYATNCTVGELNYLITGLLHAYIKKHGKKYATLNEVMGVLECAKQELYRTVAAPYEDIKRGENGSVSELDKT